MRKGKSQSQWAGVWDWDKDTDADSRAFVAAHTYWDNPHSAVMALLGVSTRGEDPVSYDAYMLWLMTLPQGLNAYEFERRWGLLDRVGPTQLAASVLQEIANDFKGSTGTEGEGEQSSVPQ